jgi:uncharacterized protein YhbP (UPF0306 family)
MTDWVGKSRSNVARFLVISDPMKYKIFVDTNQLYNEIPLDQVFNRRIDDLVAFLKSNKVTNVAICLPEIMIRERIQHKLELIDKHLLAVNESIENLSKLKHAKKQVKPRRDYKKQLEKNVSDYIKKHKLERVPIPKISKDELLDRALNKIKPFNDNTAGFKDTLIFLSIVEDALGKDKADVYIFCTGDSKEFTDDVIKEFNDVTGKTLILLPSIAKVSEKLDELLPLNLHLEVRNQNIKNIVLGSLGSIMSEVNKRKPGKSQSSMSNLMMSSAFAYQPITDIYNNTVFSQSSALNKDEIAGYDYDGIELDSFTDVGNGRFTVSARLSTKVIFKDKVDEDVYMYDSYATTARKMRSSSVFSTGFYGSVQSFPTHQTFFLKIDCDTGSNKINIASIGDTLLF